MPSWLLRAVVVALLLAAAEVAQGALRVRFLNRPLGDRRARQVGVLTGSLLILALAWVSVPWIAAPTAAAWCGVGGVWLTVMLALDLYFGRVVFRVSWERLAAEFDPRQGGLLALGMLVLLVAPVLVATLRAR